MQLTIKQRYALELIYIERGYGKSDKRIHKNTINSLYKKGLINCFIYANCAQWQLTDKALDLLGI